MTPQEYEKIPDEEKIEALRLLTASRGWKMLCVIAEIQVTARKNQVLYRPLQDQGGVLAQEFMKGEIQGLENLLKLPDTIVNAEALMKSEPNE